jgi:Lrp/AsnC family leucine-responsive transcriptional regulator
LVDALDKKALQHLMTAGRATWAELGQLLGLSAPAAAERVRKLEESGVIKHYAAIADPDALGLSLLAFVAVTLSTHRQRQSFLRAIGKLPQITECHHIAGDADYLLKIRCSGTKELDQLLAVVLKERLRVASTRTTIVLSTAKESISLPLNP